MSIISNWFNIVCCCSYVSASSAISSAKAKTPTKSSPSLIPSSLVSKILMIYLISRLKRIGEVLLPVLLLSGSQLPVMEFD